MERKNRTNFMKLNFGRRQLLNLFSGPLLAFAVVAGMYASPFDKTPPPRPQLSTSHGPIKSEGAIKEEIQGSIDVLLTDMPLTDAELERAQETRGVPLLHIATAVTAVVLCYNVDGLDKPLNFSSDTFAAIFLGKIMKWNDPAIQALNPSVHLPAEDIIVVGHAGEDGSTYAWTDFLSKTNTDWQRSVGRVRSLLTLPALARAPTAEALAELVKHTPNSIT
jgi:phosphate transport system substrate-binding protein